VKNPSISGDLWLVVASWFLRRSGSRVSILMACRHTVPLAHSLCVNPMPSRTTRKSSRPRVADRTMVDAVQPHALASFRNRSALSLTNRRCNRRDGTKQNQKPQGKTRDSSVTHFWTRDWMLRTT